MSFSGKIKYRWKLIHCDIRGDGDDIPYPPCRTILELNIPAQGAPVDLGFEGNRGRTHGIGTQRNLLDENVRKDLYVTQSRTALAPARICGEWSKKLFEVSDLDIQTGEVQVSGREFVQTQVQTLYHKTTILTHKLDARLLYGDAFRRLTFIHKKCQQASGGIVGHGVRGLVSLRSSWINKAIQMLHSHLANEVTRIGIKIKRTIPENLQSLDRQKLAGELRVFLGNG